MGRVNWSRLRHIVPVDVVVDSYVVSTETKVDGACRGDAAQDGTGFKQRVGGVVRRCMEILYMKCVAILRRGCGTR